MPTPAIRKNPVANKLITRYIRFCAIKQDEIKINFAQKVTAKSHEGMIKVSPLMSGESLSGDVHLRVATSA